MKASVDVISFALYIRVHLAPLREVFDEFQRKVSELSPRITAKNTLRILLLGMTFGYLKVNSSLDDKLIQINLEDKR